MFDESNLRKIHVSLDTLSNVTEDMMVLSEAARVMGNVILAKTMSDLSLQVEAAGRVISGGVNQMVGDAVRSVDQSTANMMHAIIAVAGGHDE